MSSSGSSSSSPPATTSVADGVADLITGNSIPVLSIIILMALQLLVDLCHFALDAFVEWQKVKAKREANRIAAAAPSPEVKVTINNSPPHSRHHSRRPSREHVEMPPIFDSSVSPPATTTT